MNAKLSELKLNKVRKVLEYEVDGNKKQITIYNAIGKKRENLLNILKTGSQLRLLICCISQYLKNWLT